ncbi:hypothetical protein [Carbonactinospora thermoautotrophica]|nr:hypothetical protein [Carbonactinospora thermoautotrophica]
MSDLERSRAFYRAALEPLGFTELVVRGDTVGFGGSMTSTSGPARSR